MALRHGALQGGQPGGLRGFDPRLWVKGETSGHTQALIDFRVDCDRDTLLLVVRQEGPACHTNRRSCFYTSVVDGAEVELMSPMGD